MGLYPLLNSFRFGDSVMSKPPDLLRGVLR